MAYFPDPIYLDPHHPLPQHLFPNIPVIKDKRVEFFHYLNLNCINSLSSHYLVLVCQSFSLMQ